MGNLAKTIEWAAKGARGHTVQMSLKLGVCDILLQKLGSPGCDVWTFLRDS